MSTDKKQSEENAKRINSSSPEFSKGSTQRPEAERHKSKEGKTNDTEEEQADIEGYRKPNKPDHGIIQNND